MDFKLLIKALLVGLFEMIAVAVGFFLMLFLIVGALGFIMQFEIIAGLTLLGMLGFCVFVLIVIIKDTVMEKYKKYLWEKIEEENLNGE